MTMRTTMAMVLGAGTEHHDDGDESHDDDYSFRFHREFSIELPIRTRQANEVMNRKMNSITS